MLGRASKPLGIDGGDRIRGSCCKRTTHDADGVLWRNARASETRRRRSWNRLSAQEPGAAVRNLAWLVDRPSKRQCGVRMWRCRVSVDGQGR